MNSFVQKFHQLWQAGYTGHLDISSHAGKACVGLRVQLGYPYQSQESFYTPRHNMNCGPSRLRRRARRAAARAEKNGGVATGIKANVVNSQQNDNLENSSNEDIPLESTENVVTNEVLVKNANIAENVAASDLGSNDACTTGNIAQPDTSSVFCVATLDNCPNEVLDKEDADSIRKCLFEEKDMLENVYSSKFEIISSRSLRHNKFVHTISVELKVKMSKLQESPVQYVKKQLGLKNWSLENGTTVRLSRIHSKS